MAMYEIAVLGAPTPDQLAHLVAEIKGAVGDFGLVYGTDIVLHDHPPTFRPSMKTAAVVVFFGAASVVSMDVASIIDVDRTPAVVVASTEKRVSAEVPVGLRSLNCLMYDKQGPERIAGTILGCLGLLPRQRRVFLSYLRNAATPAAIQLFSELSSRQFEVFLDTHGVNVADDFQDELWHRLCDVDVLIMLETPNYFTSRWTKAEYGRALAKGIGVLRIEWPTLTASSPYSATASRVSLKHVDIDANGFFTQPAIDRICTQLEKVRVTSHATRHLSVVDAVGVAVERIGGSVTGIGPNRIMQISLHNHEIVVQPIIGIPTSMTLQNIVEYADGQEAAVVYDHLGIKPSWQTHIEWLAHNVSSARWIKTSQAAWDFAGWGT